MRRLALLIWILCAAPALSTPFAETLNFELPAAAEEALASMRAQRIQADVRFLSSDLLEGRGTGQRGGRLAAAYIAAQFEMMGLKPGAPDGTYFQTVPLVGITTKTGTTLRLTTSRGDLPLEYLENYVAWTPSEKEVAEQTSDLVFVGYGAVAPEFDWDDYKGVDVAGKTLLMLVNDPPSEDTQFFGGPGLTYYGRWTYKFEMGRAKKARGVILIHTTPLAGYGWNVVANSWSKEQPFVALKPGEPSLDLESWISEDMARELFEGAGKDFEQMLEAAGHSDFRPVPLEVEVASRIESRVRPIKTANVLGLLPGSDTKKSKEVVVYTAHYDHLGIGKPENGDAIFNGAVDNASGVAVMLELARVLANGKQRPDRSLLFVAAAAEEGGLRGSQFYATHPTYPPGKTAANLNVDSVHFLGEAQEYTFLGTEKTTLGSVVDWAGMKYGFTSVPDPKPGQGSYYRSDHFNFAKVGVPAISIKQGNKFKGRSEKWGQKQWQEFNENSYHRPGDEFDPSWDYSGLVRLGRIIGAMGWVIASQEGLPSWQPGDEFLPAREASWK